MTVTLSMHTCIFRSLFFFLCFPLTGVGQDIVFSLETRYNFPINEFNQKLNASSFPEIAGAAYYEFSDKPIAAGLSVGYGLYGRLLEKRNDLYNGDSQTLRIRRNNNFLNIRGHYRHYLPWVNNNKLFVDAFLGASKLYTRYFIREKIFSETIEEGLDHSNLTLTYGMALGYKLPFSFNNNGPHLEVKAIYNNSNPTRFLPKGAVTTTKKPGEDAIFHYNTSRSTLEMFQIAIAIVGI